MNHWTLLGVVCGSLVAFPRCSVEAGKIPTAAIVHDEDTVVKTRSEIRSSLSEIQNSVALVGRVQTMIQRGLEDRSLDMGQASLQPGGQFMAPSEADILTFDPTHPERFSYQLNNSASVNIKTKTGGTVNVVLTGSLDDRGDRVVLKDAKLDVIHSTTNERQVFHVLFEKHTDSDGEATTDWSVDFHQLNALYRAMSGETESLSMLEGTLEVSISKQRTSVAAKEFVLRRHDIVVSFDEIDIELAVQPVKTQRLNVSGHVDQAGIRKGEFSVKQDRSAQGAEFKLNFSF